MLLLLSVDFFFSNFFSKKIIQKLSNSLDPDQDGHPDGPDLGPNCLYSRYEVNRGCIVFAFSVIMFVCLFVCLFVCKLFFPSKISQQLLGLGF